MILREVLFVNIIISGLVVQGDDVCVSAQFIIAHLSFQAASVTR